MGVGSMDTDVIDELLKRQQLFVDASEIRLLLSDAVGCGLPLEVFLDDGREHYWSHLVKDQAPEWNPQFSEHFSIAPLEPAVGNGRIQASKKVLLSFVKGLFTVEVRGCLFQQTERLYGNPTIRLSMPKVIRATNLRKLVRHKVPKNIKIPVSACRKQGRELFLRGFLFDIHLEGLCFVTSPSDVVFVVDDSVRVEISPKTAPAFQMLADIYLRARICFRAPFRSQQDGFDKRIFYGCQIMALSDYYMLQKLVDDLSKMGTETTEKVPMANLVESVFGNM